MKLHILTDLHIEFGPFEPPETDADLLILAGDTDIKTRGITWAKETFAGKPVIYVPGNHEYYGETYQKLRAEMREEADGSNVHLLDCAKYEQDDVVILGATLWTDFHLLGNQSIAMLTVQAGMNDFKKIRTLPQYRKFRPLDALQSHSKEKAWLEKEIHAAAGKKFVVVTHHLPSLKSIPDQWKNDHLSTGYASNLDDLVARSGAALWIHGHTHTACDYMLGETRVLCNPRGYVRREASGYDPALVVEI